MTSPLTLDLIRRFIEAGVPVTVNSDGPQAMSLRLSGEFEAVGSVHGWSLNDLVAASRRAVDAAFCDDSEKAALHAKIDTFLAANGHD